ncbi:MAG TPA: NAD(P)H-binding protein, partial [Polyangiaceae bacterium]|nr:NAD(P)H-binding protein [Polyangiaceae bacterium]
MTTLVTGATGLVGNAIVRSLIARKRSVRVLARSVDKAKSVVPEGVEVVAGDVTDPASLRRAFAGAEVAYHAAGLPEQWL